MNRFNTLCILFFIMVVFFMTTAQAQISTFPYGPYNWTGAAALSGTGGGDGNYRTSKVGPQSGLWVTSATGGVANGPCATVVGFKHSGDESYLDVVLNTTGRTFGGGETYDFQVKVSAVPAAGIGTFIVQQNASGSFVNIVSVGLNTLTTSMAPFSVSLPAAMGNKVSVTLRIVLQANSNPTATPSLFVDNNSLSGGALPVQIASLDSRVDNIDNNYNVTLNWMTVSETNNYGFYVERRASTEANFSTLNNSFVAGNGSTLEQHSYSWADENVPAGTFEYRLKQIDLDGLEHFTQPIEIVIDKATSVSENLAPAEFRLNQNYPNPFNPTTNISFSVAETRQTTLGIFNILGQHVATLFNGVADAGKLYTLTFDASDVSSGMYFYRIESGNNIEIRKMNLLK